MKPCYYLPLFYLLLFLVSCQDEEPFNEELPGSYDAATELFVEGQVPRENSFLYRVSLVNGSRQRIPTSEFSLLLNFPLGSKSVFDPTNNRSVTYRGTDNSLIFQRTAGGGTLTDFIPITVPGYAPSFNYWLEAMFFGQTTDQVWLSYNNSSSLVEVNLEQSEVSLLTDSLATGSIGLHRYLLDPGAERLYFFGEDRAANPIWADTLLIFNSSTFELTSSKRIGPVFAVIQDPATNRIFGVTSPTENRGFRLAEILPMATNPVRVISTNDLPINNVSSNLRAIHSATNSLVLTTGNNSLESTTNFLLRINLSTGELISTTEILPGTIITGIFAE